MKEINKASVFTLLLGILCHIVLLGFELPIITSAVQSVLTREPIVTTGTAGILLAHAIINTGLGGLYAILAKPQPREAVIYGAIASGLPNTVCTFAGAMLVMTSEAGRIEAALGLSLFEPSMVLGTVVFSLFTGLLAAPLGMAGTTVTIGFVERIFKR